MVYLMAFITSFTLTAASFNNVDLIINQAIKAKTLPGANLIIGKADKILKESSYGKKDAVTSNNSDTIYDVASLTKVIATTPSIMILVDQRKISLSDKVSSYFPSFTGGEKDSVTIEDLLRHEAGLLPGIDVLAGENFDQYIQRISKAALSYRPGTKAVYSDLSFILLGAIVEKVSGETLGSFSNRMIFGPLNMERTFFKVPESLRHFCAPTISGRGCKPHDPKAFALYPDELGHAGVFSTIHDVSRFARMIMNHGELEGVRILQKETVLKMQTLVNGHTRGLGWDILSEYSTAPRGEVFPEGKSFGHTGYTGTTLWIDPQSGFFYAFLSNRVFLGETRTAKPFTALRKKVSTEIGKVIYSSSTLRTKK